MVIPNWHPPRVNEWAGRHWAVKANLRKQTELFLGWYAKRCGVPLATGKRRVSVVLSGWNRGKLPDLDAFDKLLLDALVRIGLLVDDGPKWLDGRMQVVIERSRVVSTLIELEDDAAASGQA